MLLGIRAQNVHPASRSLVARQAINDAGPSLATIGSAPDERHVTVLAGGQSFAPLSGDAGRDVRSIRVIACFNGVEGSVLRHVSNVADVVPVLPAIVRVVDLVVAAHCPNHTLLNL